MCCQGAMRIHVKFRSRLAACRADTGCACRSGGKLDLGCGDNIRLRILLDGSVCEIFTSLGQVLTVRVNR